MKLSTRVGFGVLAALAAGLVAGGLVIGEMLRLNPCPLCIFQRLMYLLVALFALGGVFWPGGRRWWGVSTGALALGGLATAAYQSWLQLAVEASNECGFGEPSLIERLVDWLGMQWPAMFMATGFCSSKEWVFLGLSMANWSVLCFAALAAGAAALAFRRGR